MLKALLNCSLVQNGKTELVDIVIENGCIKEILPPGNADFKNLQTEDMGGLYASAGFIDIHVHGGGGHDFMDGTKEAYLGASALHLKHGTTAMYPTTVASSTEELLRCCAVFDECRDVLGANAKLLGMHIEGPYISANQAGALDPKFIRPPLKEEYLPILNATGSIKRWTIAPEIDGALQFGDELKRRGIIVSVGHSDATFAEVKKAVEHGFSHVTHLYSAMSSIVRIDGFRHAGVVESAYLLDNLTSEIIADGCHLPKELLQMVYRFIGKERTALVTDAMRGAGMPSGNSILGSLSDGQDVIIEDGVAKMPDRKAFAGSVCTADRLVRTMIKTAGVNLPDAIEMMTKTPAKIMGIEDKYGTIKPNACADIVIYDDEIEIKKVYLNGEIKVDKGQTI